MKKFIYFIMAAVLTLLPLDVFAEIKGVLHTDKDVSRGEKLNVQVSLEYSGKHEEIDVYQAVLEYDENLFSGIDENSFKTSDGWSDLRYNKDTHSLLLLNRYGSSRDEDVVSFDLILKETVNPAQTKIRLSKQVVSNQKGDYVLKDVENDVDVNVHLMNLGVLKNSKTSYGNALIEQPVKSYHFSTLVVLEVLIAVIMVLLFVVIRKRISNTILKKSFVGTLMVIELFALSAIFTYDVNKGDLNGDKLLDESDVTVLADHLVNTQMMSSFKLENADMNGDGKVTPTDLSILVGKTSGRAYYEAKLANAVMESAGYEKGTTVDLRFLADVTNDVDIEYVVLKGNRYKVEKVEGSDREYSIKLEAEDKANKYNYNISEVILKNGKTARVDYDAEVFVLKDVPELTAFSTKESISTSSVKVALTIKDDDKAITNAKYELVRSNGEVVANGKLDTGKNSLDLKLDNAISYKLKLKIDYDRGGNSKEFEGTVEDEYDLRIITDYRLVMNNFGLVQNGINTDKLEKNTATYLTFYSTNVSGYAPRKLNVAGREYTVNSLGRNRYQVAIPNSILNGSPLKIAKVTLANGKVVLVDNEIGYTLLKNRPTISDIVMSEDVENAEVKVDYHINDVDGAIDKLYVKLFDEYNRLISEKEADGGEVVLSSAMTSKYTARIYADYARTTGRQVTGELLGEKSLDAVMQMQFNEYTVENKYPDKNAIVSLKYNITSNYKSNVSKVVINNVIYDVIKTGIDTYATDVQVGAEVGIKEYVTKKVIFDNGVEFDIDATETVDVLKDYPTLENFTINENTTEAKVDIAFDLFDLDGAFRSGKILLINKNTGEIVSQKDVILGKNKASFVLENAVKYDIRIEASGLLDSETEIEESMNKFESYNLYETEYRIVNDYKLEVTDVVTMSDGVITNQFGANGAIEMSFASINVTEYEPQRVKVNGQYYDLTTVDGKYKFVMPGFTTSGSATLRMEAIVLSNHKELEVDVFKTIEILKAIPEVEEITIDKVDDSTVSVSLQIDDRDAALLSTKAVVLDIYGNEIYASAIENSQFTFDRQGNVIYTLRIVASYDLNNGTDVMEENRYIDKVIYEGRLDETDRGFDMNRISSAVLYDTRNDEIIEEVTSKNLDEFNKLAIKIVMDDATENIYSIEHYLIEDDKVKFVLASDRWVTTEEGKKTNFIKIAFPLKDETEE